MSVADVPDRSIDRHADISTRVFKVYCTLSRNRCSHDDLMESIPYHSTGEVQRFAGVRSPSRGDEATVNERDFRWFSLQQRRLEDFHESTR